MKLYELLEEMTPITNVITIQEHNSTIYYKGRLADLLYSIYKNIKDYEIDYFYVWDNKEHLGQVDIYVMENEK